VIYKGEYRVRKYFVVNNGDGLSLDPDLHPIVFSLPEPPAKRYWPRIKNYGLHPDDQVYRPEEMPPALAAMEERIIDKAHDAYERSKNNAITGYRLLRSFWAELADKADRYENEVKWMRHVIWKRYYGEWVFIDGELLWLPPRYYMYTNFWYLNVSDGYERPEFRIRDWKSACVSHYLRHTTEGFGEINDRGMAIKDEYGNYSIKNFGVRVFYGPIRPKNRRSGATHEAMNEGHEVVCTGIGKKATILSKSVTDVTGFFDDMLFPAWRRQPMFLKPTWQGTQVEGQKVEYKSASNTFSTLSMDSVFFYLKTTDEIVLDSKRLDFILLDEQGKKTGGGRVDVAERWAVSKQTLSTGDGANIHGFAMNPSTAEEMEDGAKQYKIMCDGSNFYQRSKTGQTMSGLMLIYFPAQYCLEGFVDCFGKPVMEAPTERQIRLTKKHFPNRKNAFIEFGMGSKEYLLSNREQLLVSGTPAAQSAYRALMRKHPMRYAESWIGDSGDMGFPIIKIDARLSENASSTTSWVEHGHFEWSDVFGGAVRWIPTQNKEDKFEMSMMIKSQFANRKKKAKVFNGLKQRVEWQNAPVDPRFVLGCDTFGFDNKSMADQRKDKSRKSDGGIGGYYPFDNRIDDETKPDEWQSDRFVLAYRYKPPSSDAYNEDLLMAAIFMGALVYPERNITNTWEYFIRNNHGGYLKYDIDISTGKPKEKPGYWLGASEKKEMFQLLAGYLERNVHREVHIPFLMECKDIRGPEELLNNDLIAAFGAALYGSRDIDITSKVTDNANLVKEAYEALGMSF